MPKFVVELRGVPDGGSAGFDLYLTDRVVNIEVDTERWQEPRHVSENLAIEVRNTVGPNECTVDFSESLLLIHGALDVLPRTSDAGLELTEIQVPAATRLSPFTRGSREDPNAGGETDPDARVLRSLAGVVSNLARQSNAAHDLLSSVRDAVALAAEPAQSARRVHASPGPTGGGGGGGSPSVRATLANNASSMTKATADLQDARAKQLEAIEQKEAEAKGGGPDSGGGGTPGSGTTPGGVVTPPPSGGGGGSGSPSGPADPVGTQVPAGSGGQFGSVVKKPCRIIEYVIDGQIIVIGEFDGIWHRSRGLGTYVEGPDSEPVWHPGVYDFGSWDDGIPGDPDLKDKLDAVLESRRARAAAEGDDTWSTLRGIAGFLTDLTPILGDIKGVVDSLAGFDIVTGDELSAEQRAFGAAAALVGLLTLGVGSTFLRAGTKTASKLDDVFDAARATGRLTGDDREFVEQTLRRLKEEAIATRGRGARPLRNNCEVVEEVIPSRAGRTLPRNSCVVAGTPVSVPGSGTFPIENVRPGWAVLSASAHALQLSALEVEARQVLSCSEVMASRVTQLELVRGDARETLTLTPDHLVATGGGWIEASDLEPGSSVLCRSSEHVEVRRTRTRSTAPVPVFNLQVAVDATYLAGSFEVLIHNGPPCPTWKSLTATEKRALREAMKNAKNRLLGLEGRAGSFRDLNEAARTTGREYTELYKARHGADALPPASEVITANHIPPDSLYQALGIPQLNRNTGGAINMTMERHLDMRTTHSAVNRARGLGAKATNQEYIDMLESGATRTQVFQKALADDIADMRRVAIEAGTPGLYDESIAGLVQYYRGLIPGFMRGFQP